MTQPAQELPPIPAPLPQPESYFNAPISRGGQNSGNSNVDACAALGDVHGGKIPQRARLHLAKKSQAGVGL